MPAAAKVGDMHTCPMQTPGTPPVSASDRYAYLQLLQLLA